MRRRRRARSDATSQTAKATGSAQVTQVLGDQVVLRLADGSASPIGTGLPSATLLSELDDPFALEVHRAVEVGGTEARQLPVLPLYVRRDHDALLAQAVQCAVIGTSSIAVLVADSSTGKTRACWEAIRATGAFSEDWKLWHPIDPTRPEALLSGLQHVEPRTVIWLNELQHYLLTEGSTVGERVAAGLRSLLRDPTRAPVLILGTMWRSFNQKLVDEPTASGDPHAQARALLIDCRIEVPECFVDSTLAAFREAARSDPRLELALEHARDGKLTQFLAGAPQLEQRYRLATAGVKAFVHAAMDARRIGGGLTVTQGFLEAAAAGYLTDDEWSALPATWAEEALAECLKPSRGTQGPLARVRPRSEEQAEACYRIADYLDQIGRAERAHCRPPREFWAALLTHAPDHDRVTAARAAAVRGYYRVAYKLYLSSEFIGPPYQAARLLERIGRIEEALELYKRAADEGDKMALSSAVRLLETCDRPSEAVSWLRTFIDDGDERVMDELATLLEFSGRGEAIPFYKQAVEAGVPHFVDKVAALLERVGRSSEALKWLESIADAGEPIALRELGELRERGGDIEEAIAVYQRSEEGGHDFMSLRRAAQLLDAAGRTEEAIQWLNILAEAGDRDAQREAGRLLESIDDYESAIALYDKAADAGDTAALVMMARLMEATERHHEAVTVLGDGGGSGIVTNPVLIREAARIFLDHGEKSLASALFVAAAEGHEHVALVPIANALRDSGDREQAIAAYQLAATHGNQSAMRQATKLLVEDRQAQEALDWLTGLVEVGEHSALEVIADVLDEIGRSGEADRLRRYGRDVDGSIAKPWWI
jgi:tetratricopeptide (TPR) repeat protein